MLRSVRCLLPVGGARPVRLQARCRSGWDHSPYVNRDLAGTELQIQQHLEWVKQPDARLMVNFSASPPEALIEGSDMLEFIRTRGSNPFPDSEDAIRTLSSLLTFPLTLSYGISYLFPHGSYGPTADKLNVLVLGARSESSLPALWWKELLAHSGKIANFNIRMLGPGLQLNNSLGKHDSLSVGGAARSVQIENNFPAADCDDMKLFHGHADAMPLLRWADVFVLYNPGYGTQALKESWAPSLRLLLMTRKPVLCTAYGSHDLRRDLSVLDEITMQEDDQDLGEPIDFLIPPHENPFKSFKCTIDPKEEGDQGIVTTNHSIYAFAAK